MVQVLQQSHVPNFLFRLVHRKNITMLDSTGVIRKDREGLDVNKSEFATDRNINTLEEAMHGADVFIGLSKGNILSADMLKSMADKPVVFAMANPNPKLLIPMPRVHAKM